MKNYIKIIFKILMKRTKQKIYNFPKWAKETKLETKLTIATFISGLLFSVIGIYKKNIGQDYGFFTLATVMFFVFSWSLIPITEKRKGRIARKTFVYFSMTIITLSTIRYCLEIFFTRQPSEVEFVISMLLIFLVVFFFIDAVQTLFNIISPFISKVWGKLSSKEPSPFMNFINNTMAGLVTVTAFITAIAGLIKLFIP
nr:MAG TPA: hypothetical protein [Caudoviricetes sp.]